MDKAKRKELKMGDTQTEWEFENDIKTLYDAWSEKYGTTN